VQSERWEKIQEVFHLASALPKDERHAFVEATCNSDQALIAEVMALIEADENPASLFDGNAADLASEIIGTDNGAGKNLQFGSYRVTGVLGEGGMGVVYLAERSDLHTRAAVKILRDAWLSPARRERFAAEQQTLAQLEHASIARHYDSGTLTDGTPWFVMEYVEGTPITEYCRANGCSLRERLRLFRQICEAVQYAHRNLVIHRDLKPSNILVRADGQVKLLDFGISKHLETLDSAAEQTRTALRMMTPAYASPEQIRGDAVGTHTDVYSLGVVLYELIVGRLPFDLSNKSPSEAERIILEREAERPSTAARRMSLVEGPSHLGPVSKGEWADLDVLILSAMHKDPARRFPTVWDFMRDIDHFLADEPLEARGDSARYRLGKFMSRQRRPIAAGAFVFLAVVALVVFYTLRLSSSRNVALAQTARAERIQQFTLNLLQGGDEEAGPADSLRVVTLVDRGVQEAKTLDREPATQAQMYETLGGLYQKLGQYQRSDTLMRLALVERTRLYGSDHPDVGQSLVALGMLYNSQAEYDSAEALVNRGIAMMKRHLPPDDSRIRRSLASLGQVLEEKGDYDRAIPVLNEAVKLETAQGGVTPALSVATSELANVHFYAGHFAVSDTLNRKALAIDRQLYGKTHPHIADDLMNLGAIQFEFQNYAEAERLDREALAITRSWYGNSHPETASNLTLLGRALVSEKKLDEAAAALREAVGIQERVYGPVHPRVASALNELGRVAQQQGNLDEAESDFRRMIDIYRKTYTKGHYTIGVALSNLAGVYKDRKRYAEAEKLFDEVFAIYKAQLPPEHQLVGIAKVRLGEVLLDDHKVSDAQRQFKSAEEILKKQSSPPPLWLKRAKAGQDSASVLLSRSAAVVR
jgi:serine/threonine-protein kinase